MAISDQIQWLPRAKRKSTGYSILVGKGSSNRATLSKPLADALQGVHIQWGPLDNGVANGKIVFRIARGQRPEELDDGAYHISGRQVFDGPLRRLGVPENYRVHFEFDMERAIFIETKREPLKA